MRCNSSASEPTGVAPASQQSIPELPHAGGRKPDLVRNLLSVFAAHQRALRALPRHRLHLQSLHLSNRESGRRQHVARFRPRNSQRRQLLAEIRDLNIVHDDVVVEGRENLLGLPAVGVHRDRLAAIVGIQIAQNVPLRIQQKRIHALAHGQVADIVGDHPIQPAHAVAAGQRNLRPEPEVIDAAPAAQRRKLRLRIAKARRRGRAAILPLDWPTPAAPNPSP